MTMWSKRRHQEDPSTSVPVPDVRVSDEAAAALQQARAAQHDTARRAAELRPLLRSLQKHLADNEIAVHVAANDARRLAT